MNAKQAVKLIGRFGYYQHRELSGLQFLVYILDVRTVFGRTEFLVEPAQGQGKHWVRQDSVTLTK